MASINSPEDVVNLALVRVGYKMRVGSLFEGSPAAKAALSIYGQTRDACLRLYPWGFATKIAQNTLSGFPAPAPWSYEYIYPVDCLQIRYMYTPGADPNDPSPFLFAVGTDAQVPAPSKVIWGHLSEVTIVYTSRVTNPATWEPLFIDLLVERLAKQLAPALAGIEQASQLKIDTDHEAGEAEEQVG